MEAVSTLLRLEITGMKNTAFHFEKNHRF